MKIVFYLSWLKRGKLPKKAFKEAHFGALLEEYTGRISQFSGCEIRGGVPESGGSGTTVWVCERERKAQEMTSDRISSKLQTLMDVGTKTLSIVIGGPDGFTEHDFKEMAPELRWSFERYSENNELGTLLALLAGLLAFGARLLLGA